VENFPPAPTKILEIFRVPAFLRKNVFANNFVPVFD
jgi:hypothetical protein